MTIIDTHTHLSFNASLDGKVGELLDSMKKAGIEKACVYAGEFGDCSTEKLLDTVRGHNTSLYPIGSVSPLSQKKPSLEQVEVWLKTGQIHGLKFYTGYEYFYPADLIVRPYLELLATHGKPAVFHSGDTYRNIKNAKLKYAHPLMIDDLAAEMPSLKIIIAHLGYPWIIDAAEVCFKNENVYADLSGFVYGLFKEADRRVFRGLVKQFIQYAGGTEKLLFGTDWPVSDQKSYVGVVKSIFSQKEKEKIFSKNAIKVFSI